MEIYISVRKIDRSICERVIALFDLYTDLLTWRFTYRYVRLIDPYVKELLPNDYFIKTVVCTSPPTSVGL